MRSTRKSISEVVWVVRLEITVRPMPDHTVWMPSGSRAPSVLARGSISVKKNMLDHASQRQQPRRLPRIALSMRRSRG